MPLRQKLKQQTPLITIPLVGPGFRGLNTELANAEGFNQTDWAAVLDNAVWDDLGRVTMRKGYLDQTTTGPGVTDKLYHVHEYLRQDGSVSLVCVSDAFKIWLSNDDGVTWTDITGDLDGLFTNLDLQFANFNDDLYIGIRGHRVHRYNDVLTQFTDIPTAPVSSGSLIGTYGRLWAGTDSNSQVGYCGLLDGTDWSGTSAGTIDASNAWTDGQDTIEALASFGASLLFFGQRHILVYVDGAGSELGVDPDNLYVVDTIEGTGTTHRDSIVNIGEGDLWYLGPQGIQSLARVIADKVNPLTDISRNQRSFVQAQVTNHVGAAASVKAAYSHRERLVMFTFPETNRVLTYDLRVPLGDGEWRCSTWTTTDKIRGIVVRRNEDILFGMDNGGVSKYTGYRDQATIYDLVYATPWLNFGQELHTAVKILKSGYMYIYGAGILSGTIRWGLDFRPLEYSMTFSNTYTASGAEWGSGEWAEDEFGEGVRMRKEEFALWTEGQFIKYYMTMQSNTDAKVALQELALRVKPGRRV
jgi:hypothetical protein